MTSVFSKSRFRTPNDYRSVKYQQLSHLDDTTQDSHHRNTTEFELKNRQTNSSDGSPAHRQRPQPLDDYIPYRVNGNESLRAIALRYGCSVSQIKQINHLMSDQEFYGLRVLKLPAKKCGILSDVLVHQINSQQCHPSRADNTPLTVNIGISQHLSHTSAHNGLKFLSHMDEDLRRLRQSTETVIQRSAIDNLEQTLSASCDANEVQVVDGKQSVNRSAFLSCDQSDYGINWCNLLLLAFVLCFISPIVYVIYISESNHNHNTTDSVHNHILSHH